MPKYKLNVTRDVDVDDDGPILNLPKGFCFDESGNKPNDTCHVKGFDTMKDLRAAIRIEVVVCGCNSCKAVTQQQQLVL